MRHDGAAPALTRAVLEVYPSAVSPARVPNGSGHSEPCLDDANDCDCAGTTWSEVG